MSKTFSVLTALFAGALFLIWAPGDRGTSQEALPFLGAPVSMGEVAVAGSNVAARAAFPAAAGAEGAYAQAALLPPVAEPEDLDLNPEELNAVIRRTCIACHNDQMMTGNLSLDGFDVAAPYERWDAAEKLIGKLRANMMPPPGMPRPGGDTLLALARTVEEKVDAWAEENPNPGSRYFQRLNRPEYERAIRELLGMEVDADEFLPPDQRSANFDNIADAQLMSPTLVTAYMNAASAISRRALGDPNVSPRETSYRVSTQASQRERVDGAPMGSRGGLSQIHNFPADGEYVFRAYFQHTVVGEFFGQTVPDEQLEISIDGERVALLDLDRWMDEREGRQVFMETEPIDVTAGPRRVSAVFVKRAEGPEDQLNSPHGWSFPDRHIGSAGYGVEHYPHLQTFSLRGPYNARGVSETEVRQRILTCRPETEAEKRPCAEEILSGLAEQAFRGMVNDQDLEGLVALYERGAADGGFEEGVRLGLQGILANPKFVFRIEQPAVPVAGDEIYPISDISLASRLSFFLWNLPPDQELLDLARAGELNDDEELERQVQRMLQDPRAEALGTRFAAQWLRLHDLDDVSPDAFWFPDFDEQLKGAMRRETELFFTSLVQEDRGYFELLDADYTYLNERLARHYGISGVVGDEFRRVEVEDPNRRGLLGHASVLTSTSFANRTSIVDRGKWVLEVLLNTPPPPPPPDVPPLDEAGSEDPGRVLTSKEQLEMHVSNPTCEGCHAIMDPIGLPLEMFDPTGRFRNVERRGMGHVAIPLDTTAEFWDGSQVRSPVELREVLKSYPETLTRAFTTNLLTYAIGRRAEYYDQPTIRKITTNAAENDYRMSSFILGVVQSDPFRTMKGQVAADELEEADDRQE